MKSIHSLTNNILQYKQKSCKNYNNGICSQSSSTKRCDCRIYAEIWAYITSVVPDAYHNANLLDFNGKYNGDNVISSETLLKVTEKIKKYCWDNLEEGEDYDHSNWFSKSAIEKRLMNGNSVAIYGNPWSYTSTSGNSNNKIKRKKLGKTLIASIIMKEAIHQRVKSERIADSYAWVDYTLLINRLMENAQSGKYEQEINYYEDSDWLAIDNIETLKGNENSRFFRQNVLDKLFSERLEQNKPNIFVFQDDITKIDIKNEFGTVINDIIYSNKTFHINLMENS